MRLIDADAFKELLGTDTKIRETFCKVIDKQPTAYDVEKVMAELEKSKDIGKRNYHQVELTAYVYAVDKAIEIAKRGGVK